MKTKNYLFFYLFILGIASTNAQVQLDATGSGNAFVVTYPAVIVSAPSGGIEFTFKANHAVTGPATLQLNSTPAKPIFKNFDKPLETGDIKAGHFVRVIYDNSSGGSWQMVSSSANPLPSGAISGSGTTNGVAFFSDNSTITANGANLSWDNVNRRLGIGTNNPIQALHIRQPNAVAVIERTANGNWASTDFVPSGALSAANPRWSHGMMGGQAYYTIQTNDGATNIPRLLISTDGNVGIGTNIPSTDRLEVRNGNLILSNSGTAGELRLLEPSAAGTNYNAFRTDVQAANITYTLPTTSPTVNQVLAAGAITPTNLTWTTPTGVSGTGTNGNVPFWTGANSLGNNNSFFWDNTNNYLGIGTNTPNNSIHLKRANAVMIIEKTSNANWATIDWTPAGTIAPGNMIWTTGLLGGTNYYSIETFDGGIKSPRMVMLNNGNTGFGTYNPNAALHIVGNSTTTGLAMMQNAQIASLTNGVLSVNGTGNVVLAPALGDNLGNHTATTQIQATLGSAAAPSYSFIGNLNTGMFRVDVDAVSLVAGGNFGLTLRNGDNVGIGSQASNPQAQLDVWEELSNTNSITTVARLTATSTGTPVPGFGAGIGFRLEDNNNVLPQIGDIFYRWSNIAGSTASGTYKSDFAIRTLDQAANGSSLERLTVLYNGNVGIGTNAPTAQLHLVKNVQNNLIIENTLNSSKVSLIAGSGAPGLEFSSTLGMAFIANGNPNIGLGTGIVRMYINGTSGNIGIGMGTNLAPTERLVVVGNTSVTGNSTISGTMVSTNARVTSLSTSGAVFADTNGDLFVSTSSGANAWTVNGTNIQPTNTTYNLNLLTTSNVYAIANQPVLRRNGNSIFLGNSTAVVGDNNLLYGSAVSAGITGANNIIFGPSAGTANTSGSDNIFMGNNAGKNNTTGNNNIALGNGSGPSGSGFVNSISLGQNAIVNASNTMVIAPSITSVGIGTLAPKNQLDVFGNIAIGTYAGVNAAPANSLIVSGRIGIGTTLPTGTSPLMVEQTNNFAEGVFYTYHTGTTNYSAIVLGRANGTQATPTATQNTNNLGAIVFRGHTGSAFQTAASQIYAVAEENFTGSFGGSSIVFSTVAKNTAAVSNEKMRLSENGNLGIGTNAPSTTLAVAGAITVDHSSLNDGTSGLFPTTALRFGSGAGEGISSKKTVGGNVNGLDFWTSTVNRMSITNAGNVGIGTSAPNIKLDVRGTNLTATTAARENILQVGATDAATPLVVRMGVKTDATPINRYGFIEALDTGPQSLILQPQAGNVGIGATFAGSTLHVNGSLQYSAITSVTGTPYNITQTDAIIVRNSNATPYTFNLPIISVAIIGRMYYILNPNPTAGGTITITSTGGSTITGTVTAVPINGGRTCICTSATTWHCW